MLQALFNVFVIMALYTVSRIFYYLTTPALFPDISFHHMMEILGGGIRFDLTAVLYLSSLYLVLALLSLPVKWRANKVYARVQKYSLLVPNALGLLANCADMVYIRFSGHRTTCTFFSEFANESNLIGIFFHSVIEYWYVTLFAIAAIVAMALLYMPYKAVFRKLSPKIYYPLATILFGISGYLTVIGMRGGFGAYTRPIDMSYAMTYVDHPAETSLVLNTPFCLMKTLGNVTYENPHYIADDELENIMSPIHATPCEPLFKSKPNVVIFILESFAAEHVGFYNPQSKPFTPFLDSLLAHSITFTHAYSSGRKSVDAPPAILSSIPKVYDPFVTSSYSTDTITSIADALNKQGYHTSFFHGAPNGSMGFEAYTHNAKFMHYYGLNEYVADNASDKKAFDGTWGIWDYDFLDYYEREIGELPRPFLTSVFTLSSHHPFKVPDSYKGKLPEGNVPLCQCIAYTDKALENFFRKAAKEDWYLNTVFVFVADHTNQQYQPEYSTDEGVFRVPLAFYIPSLAAGNDSSPIEYPRRDTTSIVSQIDIFPSIMSIIGYKEPFFAFGQNIITSPKRHNYAVTYNYPYFQVISRNGYIQFDGRKVVAVNGNIPTEEQKEMTRYLKAFIQQYIVHLVNNTMH